MQYVKDSVRKKFVRWSSSYSQLNNPEDLWIYEWALVKEMLIQCVHFRLQFECYEEHTEEFLNFCSPRIVRSLNSEKSDDFNIKNVSLLTVITPVSVPGVGTEPVRNAIFLSPAQDLDGMSTQRRTRHMLIHSWEKEKGNQEVINVGHNDWEKDAFRVHPVLYKQVFK